MNGYNHLESPPFSVGRERNDVLGFDTEASQESTGLVLPPQEPTNQQTDTQTDRHLWTSAVSKLEENLSQTDFHNFWLS
jgi:hypothetical protein